MKLAISVLLLVVLPTALLSVLAGRSISAREVLLQQRWEESAELALAEVSTDLASMIDLEAEHIAGSYGDLLVRNARFDAITALSTQLCQECRLAGEVYLFMNPWGFVFPEEEPGTSRLGRLSFAAGGVPISSPYSIPDGVKSPLIQRISEAQPRQGGISVRGEAGAFIFRRLPRRKSLYAGFAFDPVSLAEVLRDLLRERADRGLHFSVRSEEANGEAFQLLPGEAPLVIGAGIGEAGANGGITVTDSLTLEPVHLDAATVDLPVPVTETAPLATLFLPSPLDSVRLAAFTENPEAIQRASLLEARLLGWGVFLLAVVITASSGILIVYAVAQVHQAHTRSDFVFGISHDLRTPLASMRMLAESLYQKRVSDPSKQQKFLKTIVSECERLGDMIERLLFFMRQENKAATYTMLPTDIGDLAAEAVRTLSARHDARISIDLRAEEDLPMVEADAESISKVILNLLDNALKYGLREEAGTEQTHPGVVVTIGTRRRRRRTWVLIEVRDQGMGIPERERTKIFRKFYRVSTPRHKHVGGIGLGLSLCKDIVEAHGGEIRVDSQHGRGTTFAVSLPTVTQGYGEI